MNERLRIVLSWDVGVAIIAAGAVWIALPARVESSIVGAIYGAGTSVLSIVFSVFIAALAIIMSSSDDDFVTFLEEEGHFSLVLWGFQFTLGLLFAALMYSLLLQSLSAFWSAVSPTPLTHQHKVWLVFFTFLFVWSLLATLLTTYASIRYAQFRVRFLKASRRNDSKARRAEHEGD